MSRAERLQGHVELVTQLAAALTQLVSLAGVVTSVRKRRVDAGCAPEVTRRAMLSMRCGGSQAGQ